LAGADRLRRRARARCPCTADPQGGSRVRAALQVEHPDRCVGRQLLAMGHARKLLQLRLPRHLCHLDLGAPLLVHPRAGREREGEVERRGCGPAAGHGNRRRHPRGLGKPRRRPAASARGGCASRSEVAVSDALRGPARAVALSGRLGGPLSIRRADSPLVGGKGIGRGDRKAPSLRKITDLSNRRHTCASVLPSAPAVLNLMQPATHSSA